MTQLQINITSIARRQTPAPGGGKPYEWVGSGQVVNHDNWHAIVALADNAAGQAREKLFEGHAYNLALAPEDLVEFSIQ
jgi:hypothetical protein